MALTRRITKAVFDKLSDVEKAHYKADADESAYTLDLTDYEDPAELRRARDREKQDAATAKAEAAKLTKDLAAANEKAEAGNKDAQTLDASWKTKFETETGKLNDRINNMRNTSATDRTRGIAETMANKISTAPALLMPVLLSRLRVEFGDDDTSTLKVLDAEGKVSASTVADLEKEVLQNKEFAPILRASKASGGGAPRTGDREPGGAGRGNSPYSPQSPDLSKMKPADLAAYVAENKTGA